jgi:protein-L-isoaspartate(D-aspartate) O-methyltransferase
MANNKSEFIKQIKSLKVSKRVLSAFESVERPLFFDPFFKKQIWDFDPVPVGYGEKSDNVEILARMLNYFNPGKNWDVLEIGTGSGYSTALLSTMSSKVVSVDYNENLGKDAKKRLLDNGFFNAKFFAGDCSELDDTTGFFDGVIIFAGCMHSPYAVLNLLKPGGVAVFPMGPVQLQQLTLYKNIPANDPFKRYKFLETCIVPSIKGEYGTSNPGITVIAEKE